MKISKLLPLLALVTAVIATSSCGKLEDRINSLEQRISELENTRIPSIDEQVASIKKTIGELEKTDAGLREYISALEEKQATLETELGKTNAALTEAQKTLREEMAADKTELSGSVDVAKADVIAQLEAYKTLINGALETLNSTIESLKAKDEELQKNAEELRGYVDSENGKVRDWADATFATIEQQNKLAETVASIKTQFETLNNYTMNMDVRLTNKAEELSKSLSALDESTSQQIGALTEKLGSDISALRTELTDAYTKLVATEITRLETSMKSWVSEQLAGYYTIEQADAKLEAMRTELTGRMDSDKAYLTTLITNLETATNKKISANAGLITGLRGDLTSLSQSVAENAGKIADDAILISQNTADISKNSTAIAANTKNLAAVKKLAEDNQKLIAENSEKLVEMQRLHNSLKDSGIEDYAETVIQNTKDIASNASLIAKNAAAIQSNATAIAQNTSDIQNLSARLDATKSEIIESYTAAIAKAINDYDGTITAKLASEIAKVEDKISGLKTEVESVKSKVAALEDRVARLEEIVSQITSISYIPRYADGAERVEYTRDALDIIPGDVTMRFDVHPASAAAEIAANWEAVLSARAVYTITKAGAGDFVDLKVKGATAENGVLSVTVSTAEFNKNFMLRELATSIVLKLTSSTGNVISEYVRFSPSYAEEEQFIHYLLNNFDTDGDGALELSAVESATEVNVSGIKISNLNNVICRMPNLEKLDCSNTSISTLDLSNNLMLKSLNCANNNLSALDLGTNAALTELYCEKNKLTELDMTKNKNLIYISFGGNKLSEVKQAGRLIGKLRWSIYNYGATSTSEIGKYPTNYTYNNGRIWCPEGWRVPTKDEFLSLKDYTYVGTSIGLDGWHYFKGTTNRAIFFPIDQNGYWTTTEKDFNTSTALNYTIEPNNLTESYFCASYFHSGYADGKCETSNPVRCIKDE